MAGNGFQQNLRKYLGALNDTTTVTLAKVNWDYKVVISFMIHVYIVAIFPLYVKRIAGRPGEAGRFV
jgi:hypothetical protein